MRVKNKDNYMWDVNNTLKLTGKWMSSVISNIKFRKMKQVRISVTLYTAFRKNYNIYSKTKSVIKKC